MYDKQSCFLQALFFFLLILSRYRGDTYRPALFMGTRMKLGTKRSKTGTGIGGTYPDTLLAPGRLLLSCHEVECWGQSFPSELSPVAQRGAPQRAAQHEPSNAQHPQGTTVLQRPLRHPPRRHKEGLGPLQRPLLRSEWVPIHRPNCDAGLRGVRRTSNHQP